MRPLILISPWFGRWPEWIEFFIESCKWNPEVDWLTPTDQPPPENVAANVRYQRLSFDDYKRRAGSALGVDLAKMTPYKLCDLRPFFGLVHEADLAGYGHFGYCDTDVIFGDLRAVYTDRLLSSYEAISAHQRFLSGHLAVFRNTRRMRRFGVSIPRCRSRLEAADHFGLDERDFSKRVRPRRRRWIRRLLAPTSLYVERFSTPDALIPWPDGSPGPTSWTWVGGRLGNELGGADSLYLHFMNWQSDRWRKADEGPAPWTRLDRIVQCDWREAAERGFSISPRGIRALS